MQQHDVNARMFLVNQDLTAGDQVRVNIRCLANTAAIRREKRNGRDVIVVPSATMPDDVIMNGIRYALRRGHRQDRHRRGRGRPPGCAG